MPGKRRGPRALVAAVFAQLRGGSRGTFLAIGVLALFLVLLGVAWREYGGVVVQNPKYRISLENLEVTEQPRWISSDVKAEAYANGSLEGLSLLDQQTIRLVEQSFAMHPWVEEVQRASKAPDGSVKVLLRYRQPVLMIGVRGGYYPIDASGVVLPTAGFTQASTSNYLQFYAEGLYKVEQRLAGTKYGDDRVVAAAGIAHALGSLWRDAGLVRLDVYRLGDTPLLASRLLYEFSTRDGRRVIWGSAPGHERSGEPVAAEKVAALARFIKRNGPLTGGRQSPPIDLTKGPEESEADVASRMSQLGPHN